MGYGEGESKQVPARTDGNEPIFHEIVKIQIVK